MSPKDVASIEHHTPDAASPSAVENVPATQGMQLEAVLRPSAVEKVPAAQLRHGEAMAPRAVPYFPAWHGRHSSWTVGVLTPWV
jgi:hypothetical protein